MNFTNEVIMQFLAYTESFALNSGVDRFKHIIDGARNPATPTIRQFNEYFGFTVASDRSKTQPLEDALIKGASFPLAVSTLRARATLDPYVDEVVELVNGEVAVVNYAQVWKSKILTLDKISTEEHSWHLMVQAIHPIVYYRHEDKFLKVTLPLLQLNFISAL